MSDFTALDWIGAAISIAGVALLLAFPSAVAPAYAQMFRDFGGSLPWLTRAALSPWFAPILAVPPTACIAGALWRGALRSRRLLVVAAFLLSLAAVALCVAGLYLPIFELAGNIE